MFENAADWLNRCGQSTGDIGMRMQQRMGQEAKTVWDMAQTFERSKFRLMLNLESVVRESAAWYGCIRFWWECSDGMLALHKRQSGALAAYARPHPHTAHERFNKTTVHTRLLSTNKRRLVEVHERSLICDHARCRSSLRPTSPRTCAAGW